MLAHDLEELQFELPEAELKERFRVHDLESLNWTLRKLSALQQKEKECQQFADKEIYRVQTWLANEKKVIEDSRQLLQALVEEFAREQRANDPKWKASTPYGKVSFRKQQPKWLYDEQAALESVESSGLDKFIRTKKELDKESLKASVSVLNDGRVADTDTGVIIDGITVTEQPEALKVEVSE